MRLEVQDFRRAMGWDGSLALFPANRFPDGCLFHPKGGRHLQPESWAEGGC